MSQSPRVLVLAEHCNPEWPSLPVVGYKYARALADNADVTIATHVRNRENIEKLGELNDRVVYIDNEWIARPMYRFATALRGGDQVAWSTSQMMAYLPYVFFERQALKLFRDKLDKGRFDLVHRVTPMSPTMPSYIAGRTKQPFILGPLNGGLDWPAAFHNEQKREREMLRKLREVYRYLPFARSTYKRSDCILAAFQHTIDKLPYTMPEKVVPFPEVGFDPELFSAKDRSKPFSGSSPKRFLFAGRLVPYKLPEVAVRAFAESPAMSGHFLHIVGDGPELPRLREIANTHNATDRIIFEGRKSQTEVAEFMRRSDAFVFPSIRELGAGVVVEAMASGMTCLVTNYGAPGDLAANGRGVRIEMKPLDGLVQGYRSAMEACLKQPEEHAEMAERALNYVNEFYTWQAKAAYTIDIYNAVLRGANLQNFKAYA